jgi:hypothetical protein
MSRNMWILAALIAVIIIATIYQSEVGGGLDRPWTKCKESMIQQIFSGDCTPREGGFGGGGLERPAD